MGVCCVDGCEPNDCEDVTYFPFPIKPALRRKWREAIKASSKLHVDSKVCSRHFNSGDYERVRGKMRLKGRVVPSLFQHSNNSNDRSQPHSPSSSQSHSNPPSPASQTSQPADPHDDEKGVKDGDRRVDDDDRRVDDGERRVDDGDRRVDDGDRRVDDDRKVDDGDRTVYDGDRRVVDGDRRVDDDDKRVDDDDRRVVDGDRRVDDGDRRVDDGHRRVDDDDKRVDDEERGVDDEERGVDDEEMGVDYDEELPFMPECVITMTENGDAENCTIECVPEAILPEDSSSEPEDIGPGHKEDIEDIIANYHIKQNKKLVERLKALEEKEKQKSAQQEKTKEDKGSKPGPKPPSPQEIDSSSQGSSKSVEVVEKNDVIIEVEEDPGQTAPVYIEIPVESENNKAVENRDDCLMVLENVQVDIDPSTLMLEAQDDQDRTDDPISLLTSSDEDDVIIQEPHIDTVEVSDETDEDDVPLVRLVKEGEKNKKVTKILWGNLYEYYCMHCQWTSTNGQEYRRHKETHEKFNNSNSNSNSKVTQVVQVCDVCKFTSVSKTQFARHRKRHREEKRYKCNLCEYRAKHNMSLIYHMKSHQKEIRVETINLPSYFLPLRKKMNVKKIKYAFKCHSCDFKSNVRSEMLSHVKNCCDRKYSCDNCDYSTKRRSDLKRHRQKRHNADSDEDYVPA